MWNEAAIQDDWFRAHYVYAGKILGDWLAEAGLDYPNATVLDFGCGDGITDLSLCLNYRPARVIGVDLFEAAAHLPGMALRELALTALPEMLSFRTIAPGTRLAADYQLDAVVSWSTFEHVVRPLLKDVLADLYAALKPGGLFFAQIEPLYFSPYGSHLQRFTAEPWAHLLKSEAELWQLMEAHALDFSPDQKDVMARVRDEETIRNFLFKSYQELNKLTAEEFLDHVRAAGFVIEKQVIKTLEGLEIPRELRYRYRDEILLTNEVFVLARKPAALKPASENA